MESLHPKFATTQCSKMKRLAMISSNRQRYEMEEVKLTGAIMNLIGIDRREREVVRNAGLMIARVRKRERVDGVVVEVVLVVGAGIEVVVEIGVGGLRVRKVEIELILLEERGNNSI